MLKQQHYKLSKVKKKKWNHNQGPL